MRATTYATTRGRYDRRTRTLDSISLLVGLMGCVVVAIPALFPLTEPAPLLLIGSGVTVVALGGFLFFSI